LGVARVVEFDDVDLLVTLQVLIGASGNYPRIPVPLTLPGAGSRHILASYPSIGDYCIVGWMPQESTNPTNKTPVILSWVLPGVVSGLNWVTTANFTQDEAETGSHYVKNATQGVLPRVRHKMFPARSGNIIASSSQGSDLLLNEGVYLSNRRGGDFRLRDQDNASILRTVSSFQVQSGFRSYQGPVQRDHLLINPQVVSDGQEWEAPFEENLLPVSAVESGTLEPSFIFEGGINWQNSLNPYLFLQKGGLIDVDGRLVSEESLSSYLYGGKSVFRVASSGGSNSASSNIPTLTEWSIELDHTSDQTLPVTEQTELYDFEKKNNGKYLSLQLGSVVGNDPYSPQGRSQYGKPLVFNVFSGNKLSPTLSSAEIGQGDTDLKTPMEEHLAGLFNFKPINGDKSYYWSLNKKGQVKAFIPGPVKENSLELGLQGGLKLFVGGALDLNMDDGIIFKSKGKSPVELSSEKGYVHIYGGGSKFSPTQNNTGNSENSPSVFIESRTNMRLQAEKKILLQSSALESKSSSVSIDANQSIRLQSTGKIALQSDTLSFVSTGKTSQLFSGPPLFIPVNGALHERTYVPAFPGLTAEDVLYVWGDRKETFLLGNHRTHVVLGNASYEVDLGTVTLRSGVNVLNLGPASMVGSVTGAVTVAALGGISTLSGTAGAALSSEAGIAAVRGTAGVYLGGPVFGPDIGPILCAGSLDPLTGLPFGTFGIGAKGHIIGV
jgi:hypothetical protein